MPTIAYGIGLLIFFLITSAFQLLQNDAFFQKPFGMSESLLSFGIALVCIFRLRIHGALPSRPRYRNQGSYLFFKSLCPPRGKLGGGSGQENPLLGNSKSYWDRWSPIVKANSHSFLVHGCSVWKLSPAKSEEALSKYCCTLLPCSLTGLHPPPLHLPLAAYPDLPLWQLELPFHCQPAFTDPESTHNLASAPGFCSSFCTCSLPKLDSCQRFLKMSDPRSISTVIVFTLSVHVTVTRIVAAVY